MTAPGARVAGRYLLRSRLGGGAMGAVWLARDELLGRDVAVKQVLVPAGSDPEATAQHREAAMREGRITARLSHPHAVSVYDMVDDGGTPWLVMEHLPSRSLAQVLADGGTLPVREVAQIGAQVADALVATHAAGVVHRDVKPGNILIGEGDRSQGVVKITDFGISRARGDVSLTQTGVVKGTPAFLAPEVARGQEPDEASDVYSLGATLYACLEGTPPFGMTENPLEMLYRVAGGDFQPPRNAGALTRPLTAMLDSDPTKRPTMDRVRDQLAELAAGPGRNVTEVLTARTALTRTLTDARSVPDPARSTAPQPVTPAVTRARTTVAPPVSLPSAEPPQIEPPQTGPPLTEPPLTEPPPTGPPPVADDPSTSRPGRRGRLAALAALLVAALAVAAVVFWQVGQDEDPATTANAGTGAPASTSAPASPTTAEAVPPPSASAPTTTTTAASSSPEAPATTEPSPTTAGDDEVQQGSAAEVIAAVTNYYALLPDDPQSAYERTGPTLRAAASRGNYIAFWNRFSSVSLGPVSATDGSLTATAPVTYVENGERLPEQHTFVLVRGDDGQLLIDSDRAG
jgi:serine/threonine protein kinase